MFRSTLAMLALTVALSACATKSAGQVQLGGRDWRLSEIGGRRAEPADTSRRPWLRFAVDSNRVSGHLGCNRASGAFTAAGDSLRFGAIMSTRMACADDAMNRQEAALAGVLQQATRFRIADDVLELLQGPTVLARFIR